jgi:hypothetical protein
MTPRPKILLDSGAFTAAQRGVTLDLARYIEFIRRHEHLLEAYVCLDQIPGTEGRREFRSEHIERAAEISYRNQQIMKEAGLRPIPVFHKGESFKWLERYLADDETYVALASADKGTDAIRWLHDCFTLLRDRPEVRVHGLAFTAPHIMRRFPFSRSTRVPGRSRQGSVRYQCPLIATASPITIGAIRLM